MKGIATKKVPGGKLLRVKSEFQEVVESVQLTGDFFLHPEDALGGLEKSLEGIAVDSPAEIFLERLREAIQKNNIELIGVSPEDIVSTLLESLQNGLPVQTLTS